MPPDGEPLHLTRNRTFKKAKFSISSKYSKLRTVALENVILERKIRSFDP